MRRTISINGIPVGDEHEIYVIAEIGLNHNGSLDMAMQLIDVAADAGCNAVKLQKRTLEELYTADVLENPNHFEEGFQYFIPILREIEFDKEQFDKLIRHAQLRGLEFLCTPFDESAIKFLDQYHLPAFKVASADFTNFLLLKSLVERKRPLILSTGMSTQEEIDGVVEFLEKEEVQYMLLHCVSAYPTPPEDVHLNYIQIMRKRYGVPIGYSGHEVGFEITLAAIAAGACLVERHITLDKTLDGPDHTSSLEPDELKELVKRIRLLQRAMGSPTKIVSRGVVRTKEILSKSLVANQEIPAGTTISDDMIAAKSPGKGLSPFHLHKLVGRPICRCMQQDEYFLPQDLEDQKEQPPIPEFQTAWGMKGRFRDMDKYEQYGVNFVEVHMNDKDVDYPFEELHQTEKYPFGLIVHCPVYWFRSVTNLASEDEEERQEHIKVIQRVIDLTRRIAPRFKGEPSIVIHLGGMDIHEVKETQKLKDLTHDSMHQLNWDGVRFLPENMPPRPWYFSGQWFDNVYCTAEDMLEVCSEFDLKMCLDLSHAKLHTNYSGEDYWEYLRKLAPITGHLHIADAYGIDGEGVQIGEGEIDFAKAFSVLGERADFSKITWTPEIWQGHLHKNQGFLDALQKLHEIPQLRSA
jgi:N-acetylneuraminate synthase